MQKPLVQCAILLALTGCASTPLIHSAKVIRQHVIVVDGNGRPHEPNSPSGAAYTRDGYDKQLSEIFTAMKAFHEAHPDKKVLVFVHGGLNSLDDSLTAADKEIDPAMKAGYYPIYLDWNSDLGDCYGQHVGALTQGQSESTFGRTVLTPTYVVCDFGRAVLRAPIVWTNQIVGDLQGVTSDVLALPRKQANPSTSQSTAEFETQRWASGTHGKALADRYQQLRQDYPQLHIFIGPDLDVKAEHMLWLGTTYGITFVPKILLQPLLDWFGEPAWEVMTRRTLLAFDGATAGSSTETVNPSKAEQQDEFAHEGAMNIFRRELEHVTADPIDPTQPATRPVHHSYQVTLVAHSAGTLVVNEWLRRDMLETEWNHQFYPQIVYMAAACTVRDFSRTMVPYLLDHKETQFYSLMLHPLADLRERTEADDLIPRGSLLVWLDEFLANPLTPMDRTLGRWDNIIQAIQAIPETVYPQVNFKAFPLDPDNGAVHATAKSPYGPQFHGDFRGRPYWLPSFWKSHDQIAPAIQDPAGTSTRGNSAEPSPSF